MKRFTVKLKNKYSYINVMSNIVPSILSLTEGFNVSWHYHPTEFIGSVSEKEFSALKNKVEATGFYSMFEDVNVHTH